ncbi:AMP-binding protein [Jeongeupia sp. HS-3]|uniref:AMP-binding protein n=1 Tax=Jeongeupia sp. HS-3 TaxID=1009682 RepID=UPI0018A3804D|nr:AMP-binding protein [Jeongeupia sp. HS-3]BCL77391.1 AMP-binding protein [Jeongeupia sp. HS-3]
MLDPWPLADHAIVAWRGNAAISRDTFDADLNGAQQVLATLAAPRIALFETDSYRFAVWLIAAWRAGLAVVVPGDALPATRAALAMPWVGDVDDAALNAWTATAGMMHPAGSLSPSLSVFTSGSTGLPAEISKTIAQLRNEAEALEAAFGAGIPAGSRIVATVPHQHLYGLLFRVLWPLAAGRAFDADTLAYPESLWSLPAGEALTLIASPAILKRLPTVPDRGTIAARFDAVFSSGGPLPPDANLASRTLLGCAITEVYGSSETGGIAHRHDPFEAWTPQPGVRLEVGDDGALRVASNYLAEPGWYPTSDRAAILDGKLTLLGRVDRIVKVEEKRVSLTRIETLLGACADVAVARALLLSGQRDEIGAVVVLSEAGRDVLARDGKAALDRRLRAALENDIERIGLPRRWRYVAELPHNGMGKTPEALLAALFAAPRPRFAHIVAETPAVDALTLTLHIAASLIHFDGHFDQTPVLPGVTQIDWAVHYGRERLGIHGDFAGMRTLKFQRIIQPGMDVVLVLSWDQAKKALSFAYSSDAGAHSSGKILFDEVSA